MSVVLLALAGCDLFRGADARVARAEQDMAEHRYREALIELKNALESDPGHVRGRLRLAQVEMQLGDLAAADKDLRRASELGAAAADTAVLGAQLQLALGRTRELLADIDAGKTGLGAADAALYRGLALIELKEYAAAIEHLQTVPADDPHWIEARAAMAEALADLGKTEAAMTELAALIAAQPASHVGWYTRGRLRARAGELAAAEQDLIEAQKRAGPGLPAAEQTRLLASLSEVHLARGNVEAAAATQAVLVRTSPDAVVTQVLAARIALARQDYSTATAVLQRAVLAAPDLVPVRFLLGASLFAQGNFGQAEQQLARVVQGAPENLEARKLLARVQLRLGRADAALQMLRGAGDAADAQLDLLLGLAHLQSGQQPNALAYLERAASAGPVDSKLKLQLAAAYLSAAQPQKAVEVLGPIEDPAIQVPRAGLLAAALVAMGDVARARAEIDALSAAHPKDAAALALAADFHAQQRDFARARELAQRALDTDPRDPHLLLMRARVEAQAGDADAAAQWTARVLEIDPDNVPARLSQAGMAARRGDLDTAVRALEELRRRDPDSIDARQQLLAIYLGRHDTQAAQPLIEELAALGRTRPDVTNALGMLLFENGRYDEALGRFRDAALLDSANPMYWLNTARAQISLGDRGVARESLQKAVSARPNWLPAVSTLALLEAAEGRGAQALERIGALKSARPRDADARMLEGDVHLLMREYAKAEESFAAAAAITPSATAAYKRYQARSAGGLPEPAQPLERWIAGHPDDVAVRMVLAEAYQQRGELRRAVREYEAIRSAGKATPVLLNNLAWVYYLLRDPQSQAVARQAYDSAPAVAAIADTYGWILLESGKAAQALPILASAAQGSSDSATQYHYAVALIKTGSREEGLKRLRELLARDAHFDGAADARKLLASDAGT
jgi:putative PEP-CTERM system TPR-repeat lipoprotein